MSGPFASVSGAGLIAVAAGAVLGTSLLALLHTLIHVAGSLAAAALGFKLVTGMGR